MLFDCLFDLFIAPEYSSRNSREIFLVPIPKVDKIETSNKEIRQVFRPFLLSRSRWTIWRRTLYVAPVYFRSKWRTYYSGCGEVHE